jgi:hypothetical protein
MRLDEGQQAVAAAVEEEWLGACFATGPGDRDAAEAAVLSAYRSAGLDPPERVVWLDSPFAGAVAAALCADPTGELWRACGEPDGLAAATENALRE